MMSARPLVIGYGNTLRRDDGVGVRVAELLAVDPRMEGADILAVHQLTPELAIDVGEATLVVFVDADPSVEPGAVEVRPLALGVETTEEPGASSHRVGILELLGLAQQLTGGAPDAVAVAVGVADLELGEGLTPAVEAALPDIAERVRRLLAG
jgi:hydrogenase maturation protease